VVQEVRRLRKGERGNAMVEFAVSVAVLLTMLFGIIDIGRALFAYDWVYNAARQTTRWAMVRGAFCNNNGANLTGCPADGDRITAYVKNTNGTGLDTSGIDTGQVAVNSTCFAADTPPSNPPCAATGFVQVEILYRFHFISPFMFHRPWTMSSTSQRVVQN